MLVTVVDEHAYLLGTNLLGSEAEDEEERIDDIGLARSIGANNGVEALRKKHQTTSHHSNTHHSNPEPLIPQLT